MIYFLWKPNHQSKKFELQKIYHQEYKNLHFSYEKEKEMVKLKK